MPQPTPYAPAFEFTDFQGENPTAPLPGMRVDAEFAHLEETLNGVCTNLALIQRDDGLLRDGVVTVDSVSADMLAAIGEQVDPVKWAALSGAGGAAIDDGIDPALPGASLVTRSAAFIANLCSTSITAAVATCTRMAVDRTALAATALRNIPVSLLEAGRFGWFRWDATNFVAKYGADLNTIDPLQGCFVTPAVSTGLATDGSQGAWVRTNTLTPFHCGAVGDGVTNDQAALQAFGNLIVACNLPHDFTGLFGVASTFTLGPAVAPPTISSMPFFGRLKLQALGPMNELMRIKNCLFRKWNGSLYLQGTGNTSFASRTVLIGLYLENSSRLSFSGGISAAGFAIDCIRPGTPNNNLIDLGQVYVLDGGSGHANGFGLTGNWTSGAQSGATGSTGQTQVINLDTFYDPSFDAYLDLAGQNDPVEIRINGILRNIRSINRVAGTAVIYPWLTPADGASGTFEWCFGGGLMLRSSDGNLIGFSQLDAARCGRALSVASLYGPKGRNVQANVCGTVILIGRNNSAACLGTLLEGVYIEPGAANLEHVVLKTLPGNSFSATIIGDDGGFDLTKCSCIGYPRLTDGTVLGGELGVSGQGQFTLSKFGRLHTFLKKNLSGSLGATYTLTGQSRAPIPEVLKADTQTFQLSVQGAGEWNRLFGYSGGILVCWGTGTNGAPSGTITIKPPAGGTINGGAVDATVAYSGFTGPVKFIYEIAAAADAATQLNWKVYPVFGWKQRTSAAYDPPSIAAGGVATVDVAVTGAALGDIYEASFDKALGGLLVKAAVQAAGSVRVTFFNPTAGAIDLAAGNVTVAKV